MSTALYPIKLYLRNVPNKFFLALSLVTNISTWLWLLMNIQPQEEAIFLHYNVLFGVDYIGPWWRVFLIPIAGIIILLVNAALGWLFFQKDIFMSHVCNAMAFLCQISLCITAALLVFLNT